jgi:hypothetical protein
MMRFQSSFWRQKVFTLIIAGCVQFVVLTIVAMLIYPGGSTTDPTTPGYSFFENFLSELGLTETQAGQPNTTSAVLFVTALSLAGAGLVLFFVAFPQFFLHDRPGKILSGLGSFFGIASGLCFIGIALTPANLLLDAHVWFVMQAFRLFPVAVIFYFVAILRARHYPNRFALVFGVFAALLILYLWLLTRGPDPESFEGMVIQATGQKIISYASIVSIFIQALGAKKIAQVEAGNPSRGHDD